MVCPCQLSGSKDVAKLMRIEVDTTTLADKSAMQTCGVCIIEKPRTAHLDAWAEEMGEPLTGLLAHWYINVHALLILKRIQNNDDYGMLYFSAKGEPLPGMS